MARAFHLGWEGTAVPMAFLAVVFALSLTDAQTSAPQLPPTSDPQSPPPFPPPPAAPSPLPTANGTLPGTLQISADQPVQTVMGYNVSGFMDTNAYYGPYGNIQTDTYAVPEPNVDAKLAPPGCNVFNRWGFANYTGPLPCQVSGQPSDPSTPPCLVRSELMLGFRMFSGCSLIEVSLLQHDRFILTGFVHDDGRDKS